MSKANLVRCLLSVLLAVYMAMAMFIARGIAAAEPVAPPLVSVAGGVEGSRGFVTARQVAELIAGSGIKLQGEARAAAPLQQLEDWLNSFDNIEHANVWLDASARPHVDITPMQPVARIFTPSGSWYVNREGKKLTADARFHIDVPVAVGAFGRKVTPASILPLLERLHNNPEWDALTAQIHVDPRTDDIILMPMIRGHVVNLGDTANIDSKLRRLKSFYRKVLPVKGWNHYDTISVKWGGQVVASLRHKTIAEPLIRFDREGDETDEPELDNMLTDKPSGVSQN